MDTKKCIRCSILLNNENWSKSRQLKKWHICRPCERKSDKKYKNRRRMINKNKLPSRKGKKKCPVCKEKLQRSLFTRAPSEKDGLNALCRDCSALAKIKSNAKKYNQPFNIPNNFNGSNLRKLKEFQNYCCYFCEAKEDKITLHLDHNHITGEIRGYACRNCNTGPLAYLELYESWGRTKQLEMRKRFNYPPARSLYQVGLESPPSIEPPVRDL